MIEKELFKLKNDEYAVFVKRFFKTGKGDYAEFDCFLGIKVPILKKICKKYFSNITYTEITKLLKNKFHEVRFCALYLLVLKFEKANFQEKKKIVKIYLKHTKYINNWDLVDCSAHKIIGEYCFEINNYDLIYNLSNSYSLWEKRIAIVSTWSIIKKGIYKPTLEISKKFIYEKHNLLHKASGWMLRELYKKDKYIALTFINMYEDIMPRIMYRYATELIKK